MSPSYSKLPCVCAATADIIAAVVVATTGVVPVANIALVVAVVVSVRRRLTNIYSFAAFFVSFDQKTSLR